VAIHSRAKLAPWAFKSPLLFKANDILGETKDSSSARSSAGAIVP
jgi:hypothetical protein